MRDSLIAVKSITLIENFYVSRRGYRGTTKTDHTLKASKIKGVLSRKSGRMPFFCWQTVGKFSNKKTQGSRVRFLTCREPFLLGEK